MGLNLVTKQKFVEHGLNYLNYCEIFITYEEFANMVAGGLMQFGEPRDGTHNVHTVLNKLHCSVLANDIYIIYGLPDNSFINSDNMA
jgi:hypothetical protein